MKKYLYLSVCLAILFASCEEAEVNSEFNSSDYWAAHHLQQWDSTSTANNLLGTWTWKYNVCCPFTKGFEGVKKDKENLKVKFTTNTIEVVQNGEITQTSNWSINRKNEALYGLEMDNPIHQLYGRILFSDNKVLFNDSYLDGADNYFIKDLSASAN